jgi:putative FmdB family regulatory protein
LGSYDQIEASRRQTILEIPIRGKSAYTAIIIQEAVPGTIPMPIYEYVCEDCKAQFEKIVINKQQEISCPKCASKKATIQLSVFATAGSGGSSAPSGSSSSGGGGCCGGGCSCH